MSKFKAMEVTHMKGNISLENLPEGLDYMGFMKDADLGIQISKDGKVWICIDGIAFLRFKPNR